MNLKRSTDYCFRQRVQFLPHTPAECNDRDRILETSALGRFQSAERAMPTHDDYAKATNLLSA